VLSGAPAPRTCSRGRQRAATPLDPESLHQGLRSRRRTCHSCPVRIARGHLSLPSTMARRAPAKLALRSGVPCSACLTNRLNYDVCHLDSSFAAVPWPSSGVTSACPARSSAIGSVCSCRGRVGCTGQLSMTSGRRRTQRGSNPRSTPLPMPCRRGICGCRRAPHLRPAWNSRLLGSHSTPRGILDHPPGYGCGARARLAAALG
jgi:hypothetical protein